MPERIQIVDENDQSIGASTRQEAWASGLYYRLEHNPEDFTPAMVKAVKEFYQ